MADGISPTDQQFKDAGWLALALDPVKYEQTRVTAQEDPPEDDTGFIDLDPKSDEKISAVLVAAQMRENPAKQTGRINITDVLNATAYQVTINGSACLYTSDASATEQEILDGLQAIINSTVGPSGTGAVTTTQETVDSVNYIRVRSVNTTAFTMVNDYPARQTTALEATGFTPEVWGIVKGETVPHILSGYSQTDIGAKTNNWLQRINIAGLAKLKVVFRSLSGGYIDGAVFVCLLPGATA